MVVLFSRATPTGQFSVSYMWDHASDPAKQVAKRTTRLALLSLPLPFPQVNAAALDRILVELERVLRSILEPVATKVTSVNDEEFQTETCGTFRLEGDLWEPAPAVVTPSLQKGDSVELFVENERWDTYAVTNVVMRDGQMISFSIPGQSGIKAATYGESWRLPGMTVEESDAGADYLVRCHPSPFTSHAPPECPPRSFPSLRQATKDVICVALDAGVSSYSDIVSFSTRLCPDKTVTKEMGPRAIEKHGLFSRDGDDFTLLEDGASVVSRLKSTHTGLAAAVEAAKVAPLEEKVPFSQRSVSPIQNLLTSNRRSLSRSSRLLRQCLRRRGLRRARGARRASGRRATPTIGTRCAPPRSGRSSSRFPTRRRSKRASSSCSVKRIRTDQT